MRLVNTHQDRISETTRCSILNAFPLYIDLLGVLFALLKGV